MDQELKQRLIGAIVITALAAIFVPMLFDDPVDESGQMVNELALPEMPVKSFDETASRLPAAGAENRMRDDLVGEGEDFESVEEEPVGEYGYNPEPYVAEPIDDAGFEPEPYVEEPVADAGFEPEPYVEEPVYEAEIDPEPVASAPVKSAQAIKPQELSSVSSAPGSGDDGADWYIQLGSFSQKENAFSLQDKLRSQGFPAFIDEVKAGKGKSYRLVVGPVHDKNRAQAMQTQLDKQNQTKSLLMAAGQTRTEKASASAAKIQPATEARPAARPETKPSRTAPAMIRWYIQLGSFSQQENAYSLRDKLRSQGFPAFIDEAVIDNAKSYRLRVGPELDKKRAETMRAKLEKQNRLNSLLVSE